MKKFRIYTDSCSDLERELREKYDIEYVQMSVSIDGESHSASLDWEEISVGDYYDVMRNNRRILTAQANTQDYTQEFEKSINEGYDILYIACSSALSASVKASNVAREELLKKYPEANIVCIDSLISGYGLGYLCMIASQLRSKGKTLEEVAKYIEDNKLNVHQYGTVGELKYLKWSGRIKSTAALFGTILNIKPIIISDAKGRNVSIEKVKGRKNTIDRMAQLFKDNYKPDDNPEIFISHADSLEDACTLKERILDINPKAQVHIGYVNPIVGASTGPDTLILYFFGDPITYCED